MQTEKETKMDKTRMIERIHELADYYGYEEQSELLIEECSELIQAISKYRRALDPDSKKKVLVNYVEEIADVELVLEQVKYLLHIKESDLQAQKEFKIHRTEGRICQNLA